MFNSNLNINDILNFCNLASGFLNNFAIGELYIEKNSSYSFNMKNSILEDFHNSTQNGFCLRAVCGQTQYYVSENKLDEITIQEAVKKLSHLTNKNPRNSSEITGFLTGNYYPEFLNLEESTLMNTVKELMLEIHNYIATNTSLTIKNLNIGIRINEKHVWILNTKNKLINDNRPLFSLVVNMVVAKNTPKGLKENSYYCTFSQRNVLTSLLNGWQPEINKLIKEAEIMIDAENSPAGEFPVLFGCGNPGILLHEAIGHGLEGDFNQKNISAFSNEIGKKVASEGVTIIDDGTLKNRRGSINFDDEGNASQKNILVQDGVLINYMCDQISGEYFNGSTGNGRRESFFHLPMPRMTNTFMQAGTLKKEDLFNHDEDFIYVSSFSHGQVEITSGQFAFSGCEMYLVKKGLFIPINGCTFSGIGKEVLKNIVGIADDLEFDPSGGTCGKNGQGVPVGIGLPSLMVNRMTIGGLTL